MSRGYPDSMRGGYGSTGNSSYSNGYSNTNPYGGTNPYGDDPSSGDGRGARPAFRARERRQGGYGAGTIGSGPSPFGGYASPREDDEEEGGAPQVNRPTSLERSQAKRRSGTSTYAQRSPTRQAVYGDGSQKIEQVLGYIQRDWDFMMEEKCVPVQVSLQLMDDSSLGLARRYNDFRQIHQQLQDALKAIVNEHHQGFNSSIGTFHSIQNAIQTSQMKLRGLREGLLLAKSSLSTTKPELKGLATASQNYDDMLQVLSSMLADSNLQS